MQVIVEAEHAESEIVTSAAQNNNKALSPGNSEVGSEATLVVMAGRSGMPAISGATLATDVAPPLHGDQIDRECVLPSKTGPLILAWRIAQAMHAGARSMIDACVLLRDGLQHYEADKHLRDQFIAALANQNVIPKRSARLGIVDKSKLAMLRKIAEYNHLLLDDRVFRFLEPGRSILYHVTRLYEELAGDHESRLARLVELFETQGGLTRDFLIEQIKIAIRASRPDLPKVAEPWANNDSDQPFDLVLLTPSSAADLRKLQDAYADRLPLCLRTHERVSQQAVAIIVTRLRELPAVVNRILPGCGFPTIARVCLLRHPTDADVTDAAVLVASVRGPREGDLPGLDWSTDEQQLDARSLASRLVPDATKKLHLFAADSLEGWTSIIGDANWEVERDEYASPTASHDRFPTELPNGHSAAAICRP